MAKGPFPGSGATSRQHHNLRYRKGYFSRHTDAWFNSNEFDAFIKHGAWVHAKSSNVTWCRWDASTETLYLQFKDGSLYTYPGFDRARAIGFAAAPSKGGYVWDWLRQKGAIEVG